MSFTSTVFIMLITLHVTREISGISHDGVTVGIVTIMICQFSIQHSQIESLVDKNNGTIRLLNYS